MTVLLQQTANTITEYGVQGVSALAILYFWRQDRSDREIERKNSEARYEALAKDFRTIVQDNTGMIQRLNDALVSRTVRCPFLDREMERP